MVRKEPGTVGKKKKMQMKAHSCESLQHWNQEEDPANVQGWGEKPRAKDQLSECLWTPPRQHQKAVLHRHDNRALKTHLSKTILQKYWGLLGRGMCMCWELGETRE